MQREKKAWVHRHTRVCFLHFSFPKLENVSFHVARQTAREREFGFDSRAAEGEEAKAVHEKGAPSSGEVMVTLGRRASAPEEEEEAPRPSRREAPPPAEGLGVGGAERVVLGTDKDLSYSEDGFYEGKMICIFLSPPDAPSPGIQ